MPELRGGSCHSYWAVPGEVLCFRQRLWFGTALASGRRVSSCRGWCILAQPAGHWRVTDAPSADLALGMGTIPGRSPNDEQTLSPVLGINIFMKLQWSYFLLVPNCRELFWALLSVKPPFLFANLGKYIPELWQGPTFCTGLFQRNCPSKSSSPCAHQSLGDPGCALTCSSKHDLILQ